MRKNFLLLFLMALLPLAGWAWSLTAPTTQPLYWTGGEQSLLQTLPGLPAAYDLDYATGGVVYLVTNSAIEPDAGAKAGATTAEPKATNVGLYYVWYAARPDGGAYDSESAWAYVPVRINKGNPVVTAPAGFAALTYDGSPQPLIETAATATLGATVVYSFEETGTYDASLDLIKQTNANETGYNVYYKVVGNENYNDVAPQSINVKIMKATATLTAPVLYGANEDALTYNGAAQAIIKTAASATGDGIIKYKVGEGDTWYDAFDADGVKQTNAGEYKVYYKMEAGTNYNAVDPAFVTAQAIVAKNIEGVTITIPKQTFTGSALTPDFTVKDGTADLVKDTDYEYADADWANNTNAGNSASVTVHGKGNYTGTVEKTFAINQKAIDVGGINYDNVTAAITADPKTYNGSAQEFAKMATVGTAADEVVITYGTYNLVKGTDYDISYAENTNAGVNTASITFTGKGNFRLAKTINFSIGAKPVTLTAKVEPATVGYGAEYTPGVDWGDGVTDADKTALGAITYSYKENNAGTEGAAVANPAAVGKYYVYATAAANANYSVTATKGEFEITAGQVIASISATATYGSLPTFTLTHVSGLSTGEAATFNATNNLSKVTIKKDGAVVNNLANVAKDDANLATLAAGVYDLEATASCGDSYTVIVSAGKLTVNPNAAYVFTIADIAAVDYKAAKWEPEVTVTGLTVGTDYTVSYGDDTHDNFNAGTGIVKIAGAGNYAGATGSKTFTINKADLTITADNFTGEKAWTYGTDEPTYTATVDGLKGNDALTIGGTQAGINGTLKVKRTSNETVGMHTGALVAGFYDAGDNKIAAPVAMNYNLNFVNGDLQVAKGAVVIKLKEAVTATYGDDPATSINAAIKNIANYEYVSGLSELEAANFASIINVGAATFELTETKPQVGTNYNFAIDGATSTNYGVTINPGTYNVTAADITLYAKDQAIDWSDTDPDNDAADTEVKAATVAIAAGALKYTDALTDVVASIVIASQNVGTNNISLTAAENANYNIVVNSDGTNAKYGVLTVTAAPALALSTADLDLADKLTSYNGKAMPVTIDFTARNDRELPVGTAREWKANTWNTLVLPFDISVAELSQKLGYAIVNVIDKSRTEISGTSSKFYGKLTMKGGNGDGTEDYLVANKPFMVKTADAITGIIDFGNQTIVAPASAADLSVDAGGGAKFTGTYKAKPVTGNDNAKIWFMVGNSDQWLYIGAGKSHVWNILPFEGFIDMNGSSARNMTFYFEEIDGSTTAIRNVDVDDLNGKIAAEGMYNMNGMKLNTVPTQKGVYIMNGKKVVIK